MDYLIYGVDSEGNRTRLASTPSPWAAKAYRDSRGHEKQAIAVFGSDGELSVEELDALAARENRLGQRS